MAALFEIAKSGAAAVLIFYSLRLLFVGYHIWRYGTSDFDPYWHERRGLHIDEKTNRWVATKRTPKWIIRE